MSGGPSSVREITVIIDGKTCEGTYYVEQSIVYVQSASGGKATQAGGSRPEFIARLLLSELVREGRDNR
jgi:hypothetical protein